MKKALYCKILLLLGIAIGILVNAFLFFFYRGEILESLNTIEGMQMLFIIILIRIGFIAIMSYYMFHKWFSQEEQYLSDIPFLFGLFLLLLTFGKILDLFWDLTFFTFNERFVLLLLKIRYLIVILTVAPLIFLSIQMILYIRSLGNGSEKLNDERYRIKLSLIFVIIIILIEFFAVIMAPSFTVIGILLPIIVIPSIAVIIWLFAFSYKNKRLSQVNPLILTIGFIAWMISNIIRPLLQNIFGETTTYVIYAEIIDLLVFLIIFLGFCLKAKYVED